MKRWLRHISVIAALILVTFSIQLPGAEAQMTGTIYTFTSDAAGFNTHTYFYDTGSEVIAFDAQFTPAFAQQAIAYLRTQTQNPLTYLVVTHPNPDKYNGISAFQAEGTQIVMSRQTADQLAAVHAYKRNFFINIAGAYTEETYPALGSPDIVFNGALTLLLDADRTIEITELGTSGVAGNQTVAFLPELNALIVGDLIHYQVHAWMEGPLVDNQVVYVTDDWVSTLERLGTLFPADAIVYGGRGEPIDLTTAVTTQIEYLRQAEDLTRDYLAGLNDAPVDYAALTSAFAAEFPDYDLTFMITFGAYGLVQSLQ